MSRKKKETVVETRSLREQTEAYLFDLISEFEQISGMKVERIDVKHYRSIGFGAKETMEVNIITQ